MLPSVTHPIINGVKYEVPQPKLPTNERQRRRLMFRNERNLYKRKCDLCHKDIISIYSPDKPYTVYCSDCFWSDKWDPRSYGQEFDFNKSFTEQFQALNLKVPLLANMVFNSENCEYNSFCTEAKNCYLCYRIANSEDVLHSYLSIGCLGCTDCFNTIDCKYCYECIDCWNCYNCQFVQLSRNCSDCYFCFDCIGCTDCFGSVGLRNKKYYFFNQQYSKEEYEKKVRECNLSSHKNLAKVQAMFQQHLQKMPARSLYIVNSENVSGNYITNSKNIINCFDVEKTDTAVNSWEVEYAENVFDCSYIYYGSNCYENISNSRSTNIFFSFAAFACNDLFYSMMCFNNSHDCFGSVSLKKNSYCILNKQYSKEEYFKLIPKIIEHMKNPATAQQAGKWGEFLHPSLSHFGYNESLAQKYFPLTKEEAIKAGFKWNDYVNDEFKNDKIVSAAQLPDSIQDVPDEILNWAIACESSQRPFRITKTELDFYRKHNLPLPRQHPDTRYLARFKKRSGRVLHERACDRCGKNMPSTFPADSKVMVYCEDCYQIFTQ